MDIHTMIRQYRQISGFSQKHLSDLTGIPQTTISCWERGIGEPTFSQVASIAKHLQIPSDELLNELTLSIPDDTGENKPP